MNMAFPVLIADIGGTFTRLALLLKPDEKPHLIAKFKTADYKDPQSAFLTVLEKTNTTKPRSALLAVAAPVGNKPVHLTNAAWWIDPQKIGETLAFETVSIVNDFPPIAALLPKLDPNTRDDLVRLGPVLQGDDGPMLVLGPGTGLGAAVLRKIKDHHLIESTEAGHIEFGASRDDEIALWPLIDRFEGRHTAESILCGSGIIRLWNAMMRRNNQIPPPTIDVQTITQAALSGDELAHQCLMLYARLLGRFAGDLALVFGATGGVYIAGGIAPKILPLLETSPFRQGFEDKAPFVKTLASIPTYVIARPDPALYGLVELASHADHYWIHQHTWMPSKRP
jgi:glucokinase